MPKVDKEIKRPYSTHYYTLANDREADTVSRGASSTEQGAVRAAMVRIFCGQYQKAVIFDRYTGRAILNIRPGPAGIQLRAGSGVDWMADMERRRKAFLALQKLKVAA